MSKAVMIVSYKGGVGKTTVCAALAYIAAEHTNVVTAVDLDLEFGGLDIALGEENAVGASALDLFRGKASLEQVQIPCGKEGLFLVCAPMTLSESVEDITVSMLSDALDRLKDKSDLVLLDLPAGGGPLLNRLIATNRVDEVILVSTDAPTALRSAEKCAAQLAGLGAETVRLAVNSYHVDSPDSNSVGLVEILENVSVPAIGVIPFDPSIPLGLGQGRPATAMEDAPSAIALENIFLRLAGKRVPLLDGVLKKKKRNKLYRRKQKK